MLLSTQVAPRTMTLQQRRGGHRDMQGSVPGRWEEQGTQVVGTGGRRRIGRSGRLSDRVSDHVGRGSVAAAWNSCRGRARVRAGGVLGLGGHCRHWSVRARLSGGVAREMC